MKNFLLIALSFIYGTAHAQTIYPSGVNGCIARWTFDLPEGGGGLTNIQDWSGNNNHGNNNNITSVAGWKGVAGKAGSFNGITSWSDVNHSSTLNSPNEITMISIVKFNSFNNSPCQYNQILSKGYPHFIAGNYGLGVGESDNDCNLQNQNIVALAPQCGNGQYSTPVGNYLQLNKWYFLATTISSTNVINYQIEMDSTIKSPNMTPINNTPGNYNIGVNNQNISIGKHLNPTYPYIVNGEMDEVVLFNRALTAAELLTIYEFLFGYPTSISDISKSDSYDIAISNYQLTIRSAESNFNCEIYNSLGQLLVRKQNCANFETISLPQISKEIIFIRMTTRDHKVYNCSKLLE